VIAKQLINNSFTPLHISDDITTAINKMDAWQTENIPVIDPATLKIAGQAVFSNLSDVDDESADISDIELEPPVFSYENEHIFEVARKMLHYEVRFMALVDQTESFIGIIEKKDVLEAFSKMLNIATFGSVITVEMAEADFTLTKLVNVIESEGAKILGLTVDHQNDSSPRLQVSLKLNLQDTSAVTAALERHGYVTTTENRQDLMQVDLTSRADELMRYLDL